MPYTGSFVAFGTLGTTVHTSILQAWSRHNSLKMQCVHERWVCLLVCLVEVLVLLVAFCIWHHRALHMHHGRHRTVRT